MIKTTSAIDFFKKIRRQRSQSPNKLKVIRLPPIIALKADSKFNQKKQATLIIKVAVNVIIAAILIIFGYFLVLA